MVSNFDCTSYPANGRSGSDRRNRNRTYPRSKGTLFWCPVLDCCLQVVWLGVGPFTANPQCLCQTERNMRFWFIELYLKNQALLGRIKPTKTVQHGLVFVLHISQAMVSVARMCTTVMMNKGCPYLTDWFVALKPPITCIGTTDQDSCQPNP